MDLVSLFFNFLILVVTPDQGSLIPNFQLPTSNFSYTVQSSLQNKSMKARYRFSSFICMCFSRYEIKWNDYDNIHVLLLLFPSLYQKLNPLNFSLLCDSHHFLSRIFLSNHHSTHSRSSINTKEKPSLPNPQSPIPSTQPHPSTHPPIYFFILHERMYIHTHKYSSPPPTHTHIYIPLQISPSQQ